MAKLAVKKATTDVTVYLFIQDSSVTTGAGKTGLVFNSASLVAYYVRPLGSATAITLATQTVTGAHSDGGFVEVDATNMPGVYRLDLPDAVCATGVNSVVVILKGASNMAPVSLEIQLVSYDPNDTVRLGLTALPNAAADAAGGLPISDAGGLDLDAKIGALTFTVANKVDANMTHVGGTLQTAGDLAALITAVDNFVDTEIADIQSRLPAALVGGRMDSNVGAISADATAADNLEAAYDGTGYAHTGNTYPWTAAWDAEIQSEVDDALVVHRLDELLNADSDIDGAAPPTVGSVFHELMTKTAGSFTYDQTTDSLEAIRDRGDAAWITATGFSTLSQADVRSAVGLASANLDTQLAAIDDYLDTEVAAILAAVDTEVAAIKTVTDAIGATGTGLSAIPWNAAWDAEVQSEVDDALKAALTEGYRSAGATGSVRDMLYELIAHLGESAISGTTKTLKKLDGSTTAKTYTLDSSTVPTSITETT